jgi:hypothetical protein
MPPILFCSSGYIMCNVYRSNVSHCPTCRQHTLITRNVVLENLARQLNYPCIFQQNGCREGLAGEHEKKFRYVQRACLVQKLNVGTCNWTGIAGSMNTHLKEEHMDMSYRFRTHWLFPISVFLVSKKQWKFILYDSSVFCFCCEINDRIFYSVLQYILTAEFAAKYRYDVELFNK